MYDLLREKDVGKNDVNGSYGNKMLCSNSMLLDKMYSSNAFSEMSQNTMQREACKEDISKFEFGDVSKRYSKAAHIRQVSVVQREVGDIPWVIWILILLVGEGLLFESQADIIKKKSEDEAKRDIDSLAADDVRVDAIVQPRKEIKSPEVKKGKMKGKGSCAAASTSASYVTTRRKPQSAFGSQAGAKMDIVSMPTQPVTQEELDSNPVIKVGVGDVPPQAAIPHNLTSIWYNDASKGSSTIDYHYRKHKNNETLIEYLRSADRLRGVVAGIVVPKTDLDATRLQNAPPVEKDGFIIRSYIVGTMMRTKYSKSNRSEFIIVCGGQIVSYGHGDGRDEWA